MTGYGVAFGLAWRRSRFFYLWWLLGLACLMPLAVWQYDEFIRSESHPELMLELMAQNPTMRALLGPAFDLASPGGFTFWRVGLFVAIGAAMMAGLGVVRGTRADEEAGRCELIRAGSLSRHAPLAASLVLACIASAGLAAVVDSSMVATGQPLAGSAAAGAGIGLTGVVYAGVAAVFAQVFESARTVRTWTLGVALGGSYLVRARIDGMGEAGSLQALRWAVPLEWAALVRPYAAERWWVLLLPIGLGLVLAALAFWLEARRDHGAGLVPARQGPATAAAWLRGSLGLVWRVQRVSILGWLIGLGVAALGLGSLAGAMERIVAQNARFSAMVQALGGNASQFRDAYLVAMMGLMAVAVAIFAAQVLARAREEETQGRVEFLLSTAMPRVRFVAGHAGAALLVSGVALCEAGVLLALPEALATGRAAGIWEAVGAVAVLYTGVVFVVGLAVLLIGWLPRWTLVLWLVLCWSVVAVWLLPLFGLPGWLVDLHPWGYLPQLPVEELGWAPVVTELAVAASLAAVGAVGYRRRDIPR
ncbi:MAG: hypothetical protein Q3997_02900 [Propionibacteriaceae bacterium]|nr:hypothetical protein [Propionibacteriaceae bacterium]